MQPLILAHGALGDYDELLFLGVALVFVALMVVAWVRSRNSAAGKAAALPPEDATPAPGDNPPSPDAQSDHFPLA